jgi:glycosyltransferase involved in cell wall biosynthesis
MRVGLEMRYISEGACGGITPLLAQTLSRVFDLAPRDEFYFFGTMFNQDLFSNQFPNLRKYSLPLAAYWERLESLLGTTKIDVLLRGFPVDDELSFALHKQVTLVPDLQHELYPGFFSAEVLARRRKDFPRLIRGSGAVGTISEYTRSVITAHYHNQFDDIFLMPPASQFNLGSTSENVRPGFTEKIKSLQPYLFFPANMWPHKNHRLLLRAFQQFRTSRSTHGKFSLILSGHSQGWEALSTQQDAAAVTHLGFVSRDELSLVYRNAEALVFMSLCEGFGMPVLEAFGFECPVLCGNKTSLPEIAGDAALLVEPNDADAVVRAMTAIVSDEKLRASLVEKGKARFKQYSWERPAMALHKALARVHERKAQAAITLGRVVGPPVSIVTPSRNQGRFIARTIDSVLAQTYPNIEYHVVDGGSTDATLDVLRSYGTKIDWHLQPDRGQAHAINKGFVRSRGEILTYLNADDVLLPDAVETIVDLFSHNPDISMYYGDANYIDAEDRITGRYATAEYSFERLMYDCCVCQPAAFWTAKIAQKVGPFDERLNYVMDYDYWLRIDRAGGWIRHVPTVFAHSRLHPATKTRSQRRKTYHEIFAVCKRHGGYVSHNHVRGYWRHRFHEQPGWLFKLMGVTPHLERGLVGYHARRLGKPNLSPGSAIREGFRQAMGRRVPRMSRTPKPAPTLTPPKPAPILTPPSWRCVRGFWLDGWLAPVAHFTSAAVRSGQLLRLRGSPAVDCRLKIGSGTKCALAEMLEGGVETTIEFTGGNDDGVTLTFDAFEVDAARREIAFFVTHTNLFSEDEL